MGRQVFTAGEILTAANMNDLSDQSVMVFDDAAARTTAIPTPVEGMTTYLKDLDAVEFFDGSVFRRVGGLIAVKSAIRDTPEVFSSVTAGDNRAVGGLSITHEVADPANRLIILAFFGIAANNTGHADVSLAVFDGDGIIDGPDSPGARSSGHAGGRTSANSNAGTVSNLSVTFVHTPGAGSKTYTVHAINAAFNPQTVFINRTEGDQNAVDRPRAVSSLVIQEVAV